MAEDPEAQHRFGVREPRALNRIQPDVDFLSWSDGHNAVVVSCALAEDALLRQAEDSAADSLDRATLAMSLGTEVLPKDVASHVAEYCRTLRDIRLDEVRSSAWHTAGERLAQGGQLHGSQPVRALELYQEALKLFESVGDGKGAGRCRGNIGLLMLGHNHLEEGLEECMQAMQLHAPLHYDRGCLAHLGTVINVFQTHKEWEDALQLSALRLTSALRSDPTGVTIVFADAGWFAWQLGRRDVAEQHYEQAVVGLERVQTKAGYEQQIGSLRRLAHALDHQAQLEQELPRIHQQIIGNLQVLGFTGPLPALRIIDAFQSAIEHEDDKAVYAALAPSESWSALAFECALAEHARAAFSDDHEKARRWNAAARRFALAYCRSFLNRGPFDEYALYSKWTGDQHLMKARAFGLKLKALEQAAHDGAAAYASLNDAFEVHALLGARDAAGRWFPEAVRELEVDAAARAGMHRLMFRAAQESVLNREDERRSLDALLELATRTGTTLNVADARTRLAIHCVQTQRAAEAAEWFARADEAFAELESIGVSVREEPGRAHNMLKMRVHLLEFLEQEGRFGEAAAVGVAALREVDWFLLSFEHVEYVARAFDYRSRMLNALARAYERLGGYEQALGYADQLRAWSERFGNKSGLAAAHYHRATTLRELRHLSEALASAQADLELQREIGNPAETAVSLVLCAELAADLGDDARARAWAMEVLDLAASDTGAGASKRDAHYVLARLAEKAGRGEEAIQLFTGILAEEERQRGSAWIFTAAVLAEQLLHAGRAADALPLAERAWNAASAIQSQSLRLSVGFALAKCLRQVGTASAIQQAIEVLLECCRRAETIRRETKEETYKTSVAVAWVQPFELLLSILLDVIASDPNPAWTQLAFEIAERAKARALAESIAAAAARAAEAEGFRLAGMSVRPMDPREEIARVEFTALRDMLRREAGSASQGPAALT
jgi:hypothetical protein